MPRLTVHALALLACFSLVVALPAEAQYFRFGKNKVQYEALDWHYVQSRHFDVYYYEPGGRDLAEFTAEACEEAYERVADLFQHQISDRIPILVYQSHNDFAVTNAVDLGDYPEGIGGVTELFKNRVAIPFTGDYRDFRRVIHHELVHAVINDMFYGGSIQSIIQNNIQLAIPLWFNEGLAEYSALGWDTQSDMYVRDAIVSNYLAPIPYLSGYFAYRGGQSVWDYIAEQYGREKIGEILQRLRLTRSVEGSFKRATGLTLEELSERWQRSLKEVHWPEIAAREDLDVIAKAIITRERGGYYNTSPALSPQGDRIAYISTEGALFDVYLANANDGKRIKKLINGQNSTQFESLKILTPGLTWSPDGKQIALAVKSGPGDAIAVVDVKTAETVHYRVPDMDAILSVSWSPDGQKIAFSGTAGPRSDVFVLDLASRETINYTNDLFSDHEPSWSPDSRALVFHSDRGDYTTLGVHQAGGFDMLHHPYGQSDVYRLVLGNARAERLTFDETWDETSPKFGADPNRLLFISDRNGIPNLYQKDLTTGVERPLTDVVVGITQVSLSADGNKAALVSLKEGTPSIYLLKTPFDRNLDREELVPNVWAQRVNQKAGQTPPALALAPLSLLQQNPLLRDAADGIPYDQKVDRVFGALASRAASPVHTDSVLTLASTKPQEVVQEDSTAYGSVRVDFRNYVFSEAFDEAKTEESEELANLFDPVDNLEEDGRLKPKKYKLSFSPDIIYGATGYDNLYGVQSLTQMMFSDMLGNHQIFAATNFITDLRNSDYYFSYNYLPRRMDYSAFGFHIARLLFDYNQLTYFRYRQYGMGSSASYPIDKFRRLDVDLSLLGVSLTDVVDPLTPSQTYRFLYPMLTYTKDVTVPGFLYPMGGHRYALSLSGTPGWFSNQEAVRFVTVLGDARWYTSFGRYYSFAVRGSGGGSFGLNPQTFYTAGVQNWINATFESFPIDGVKDFVFATPVLPMRGYRINQQNGPYFGLVNAEFRFPLVAALLPGPLPLFPFYNIQGTAFVDAGTVFGGRGNEGFKLYGTDLLGRRVFDDLLVGTGFGLRTILLGYPVRVDFAWPYNGQEFGKRQTYFSIGLDF